MNEVKSYIIMIVGTKYDDEIDDILTSTYKSNLSIDENITNVLNEIEKRKKGIFHKKIEPIQPSRHKRPKRSLKKKFMRVDDLLGALKEIRIDKKSVKKSIRAEIEAGRKQSRLNQIQKARKDALKNLEYIEESFKKIKL